MLKGRHELLKLFTFGKIWKGKHVWISIYLLSLFISTLGAGVTFKQEKKKSQVNKTEIDRATELLREALRRYL